jgi:HEPN domain-containing protein
MERRTEEWFRQSDYDLNTAEYMFQGGRYMYAVFMCHLAIEKALKGLYYEKLLNFPPKTHSLVYLLNALGIKPPAVPGKFIIRIGEASIPVRYPEDLAQAQQAYTETVTKGLLAMTKDTIVWIKAQLPK